MADEDAAVQEFLAREQNDLAGLEDDEFADPVPQQQEFEPHQQEFDSIPVSEQNGFENGYGEQPEQFSSPVPTRPSVPKIEPEKIRKWREEQKTRLEKKDSEEEKEKNKLCVLAKKELEEWYKSRKEELEKRKKNNRTQEKEFIRDRDADKPGAEWERIAKMCEFNPKAAKQAKDVTRLRSMLLQKKQEATGVK